MIPLPAVPEVLTGGVAPLGPNGPASGIDKRVAEGPWRIEPTGLAGDAQADRKHHGGPQKALHHYAFEHYAQWRHEIGDNPVLASPGAFGENLSTSGWTEANLCIGDIIRFGGAVLQISQGRQPCWKLNRRFGVRHMARLVQTSGRCGWYYRVLEPGIAQAGDRLELTERPRPDWTLERLSRLLYRDTDDRDGLAGMAEVTELAEGWRELARRRLSIGRIESWRLRLYGRTLPAGEAG